MFMCCKSGFSCGLWKFRSPLSYPWLLVKSTEEMFSGITGKIQKQGSAEAAPVGKKRRGLLFFLGKVQIMPVLLDSPTVVPTQSAKFI